MPSVRASAYACGYMYQSDTVPEQAFRRTLYDAAMQVKSNPTEKHPETTQLTDAAHFIQAGEAPDHPGKALVKWAFRLKGGGDVPVMTHFTNLPTS